MSIESDGGPVFINHDSTVRSAQRCHLYNMELSCLRNKGLFSRIGLKNFPPNSNNKTRKPHGRGVWRHITEMFLLRWADSCWLEVRLRFCRGHCRLTGMGAENKCRPHRLLSLFHSFWDPTILRRILHCFCFAAGPILFPYPNEVFLESEVSFYQPNHKFCIAPSALLSRSNNTSPSVYIQRPV